MAFYELRRFESDVLHRAAYDIGTQPKGDAGLPAPTVCVALAWGEFYAVVPFELTAALAVLENFRR